LSKATWFDLLDLDLQASLRERPNDLYHMVKAIPDDKPYIVIDEIQKVPALLDVVQRLMKDKEKIFILSGSSTRKLKADGANLLAGRAFVYHLYPFSYLELGEKFDLDAVLHWGTLPEIYQCHDDEQRREFLMAYAHTYLKEEVLAEQLVRDLAPFRKFIEVAAQCNGKIINYSNIARDVGVDDKTVKTYFGILEDTLVGFMLESYHGSLRKRIHKKPKFYFFDTGVVRALARLLSVPLLPSTNAYGNAFEHYIITECVRLNDYFRTDYKFTYIRTQNDYEVDLIIERPGQATLLIEIKSTKDVKEEMLKHLLKLKSDVENAEAMVSIP
jgi:predicted AAA+ superfamily ATPase